MSKQEIPKEILTFTIPFIPLVGGEQVNPASKIVGDSLGYFKKNYKNWQDFELDEVENDRWVILDGEWMNHGNNIKLRRAAPQAIKESENA